MFSRSNKALRKKMAAIFFTLVAAATIGLNTSLQAQQELSPKQIEIEEKKLSVERQKMWLTAGSILIPLGLGVLTLYWQSKSALKLKEKEAKDALKLKLTEAEMAQRLKAAEIILGSPSPWAAEGRMKILQTLFGQSLGEEFASFNPKDLPGTRHTELKLELFRAIAAAPSQTAPQDKERIIQLWRELFPNEKEWLDKLFGVKQPAGSTQ
jgi:hypothetical protein